MTQSGSLRSGVASYASVGATAHADDVGCPAAQVNAATRHAVALSGLTRVSQTLGSWFTG